MADLNVMKPEGSILGHPECFEFTVGNSPIVNHMRVAAASVQTCYLTDEDYCNDARCPLAGAEHKQKDHTNLPVADEPTRAGRQGDSQELPTSGPTSKLVDNEVYRKVYFCAAQARMPVVTADVVVNDLMRRTLIGVERYGTPLMTHNGRDAALDAYEEAQDLVKYIVQWHLEQPNDDDIRYLVYMATDFLLQLSQKRSA